MDGSKAAEGGMSKFKARTRLSFAVRAIVTLATMTAVLPLTAGVARAATGPVTVSLTFDDTLASQYTIGFNYALAPHNVHATFFVNSGLVNSGASKLTWPQLSTIANAGNEIGGKTVDGADLTALSTAAATAEVCNDRQALINHGLGTPDSFAYPLGKFNASVEGIVAGCGYGTGRKGGGLGLNTPSQPNPPTNYYETNVYAPNGQMTLANLQSLVTNAYNKGGGWSQILLQRVCDQGIDPGGYASCQTGIWIQLADLNAFLNWIQAAGQPGGAPAGTAINTVGSTLTASDVTPPVTSISCNGAPCSSTPYTGGNVSVALSATDAGSGLSSTHYTLDGSPPTLASPTYSGPFALSTGTTTVSYRSWDRRGNVEATKTQVVQVQSGSDTTPPVTTILCNGATCASTNYPGGVTVSFSATDGSGGSGVDKTFYTLDGTDPNTSSPVYTGPFLLAGNTTVKFFSTDLAGNAEAFHTQQLLMTAYPVTVSLTFDDQYERRSMSSRATRTRATSAA
jgi:peptidoglycan/xylan/chitin deacetylase (PgdA/CDA1 family)